MAKDSLRDEEKLVVIGGSAGSLPVIMFILQHLKPTLRIPVVVVLHRKSDSDSSLSTLMAHRAKLVVKEADDKDPIIPGMIYLAPPDYHLLVERDKHFSLDDSEKINYSRPSIDVTFESAAEAYGKGTVGILLSGANADGVDGLQVIQEHGGIIAVQDPSSAQVPYMPQAAVNQLKVERILGIQDIPGFIDSL
ncbi:chemotaxis protein CheB [Mucilaginibacter sp. RS28]|uniref:protein-glutamate methylesterase n=1 Tax=Mucilaginibacter straminoryzae TaxID=2932774 RepID=A0A9X2BAR7_9SPHI|nr:chemotaxis protein CheB [Mucilaginibacter straminoryzae]MCJ8209072.1 chemotaxis protein CheB [Mucilaginibacter straminoryzae]